MSLKNMKLFLKHEKVGTLQYHIESYLFWLYVSLVVANYISLEAFLFDVIWTNKW